jgi:hypothetical protein
MPSFVHDKPQLTACELSQAEWHLFRDTEHFLQAFKGHTKRCEGDNVTLDQLQESMDFPVDHFENQLHRHRSNRPFVERITTGWYTMDKYYNKIDESGAYAAAALLHPNKRRAYLQAAWKPRWIKPGLRRTEEFWTKKYEKSGGMSISTPSLSTDGLSDAELATGGETCYRRWRQSQYVKTQSHNMQSEFQRFINSPVKSIGFTAS